MTHAKNLSQRRPEIVGIEITRACNLTCSHCFTAAGRRPANELSTGELRRVIDELNELGPARAIGWTGGEPLLRDDLVELMDYAFKKGKMRSGVTTNGLLLNDDLAKTMRDSGVYAIQISVDGSNAENFSRMRNARQEDFAVILSAMSAVKKAGLQLHLAMLLGKETLADARDFLKLAAEQGADGVRFCGFVPAGRGHRDSIRERFEFGDQLGPLHDFIADAAVLEEPMVMFDPAFGPLPPDYQFHECMAGVQTMYIASTGAVYPCTSLISPRFEVGNIHNRSLAEIWNDPKMTEVSDFDCGKIHGKCSDCDHISECHGGCRGIAYANNLDVSSSIPNCLYEYSHNSAGQTKVHPVTLDQRFVEI